MIWTKENIANVLRSAAYSVGTTGDEQERKGARAALVSVGIAFGLVPVGPPREQGKEPELRDLVWVEAGDA